LNDYINQNAHENKLLYESLMNLIESETEASCLQAAQKCKIRNDVQELIV
ncbi:38_t:CDS:1, partial [Dentiscutata heterogama]